MQEDIEEQKIQSLEEENIKKNLKRLDDLAREGIYVNLKICPQCKAASPYIMDVVGFYFPQSYLRHVCKKCGWVGRIVIWMTNRIDERDEAMLDDIIDIVSSEIHH